MELVMPHVSELPIHGAVGRREFIWRMACAGGALAMAPPIAAGSGSAARGRDWHWLTGSWEVRHERLKERLTGNHEWEEFNGKSAFWSTLGGLGNVDDNIIDIPSGSYRGVSIRAFDPKSEKWAIWWLDGRNPTYIEPPVLGGFEGDTGTFIGRDTLRGQPILMRFRWHDVRSQRPWWEQAFSPDDGATWEVNWRNYFTRTNNVASPLPKLVSANTDFDFLAGRWTVKHRRLRERLVGSNAWDQFGGTFTNSPLLGGQGNVGDNVMEFPVGTVRGVGLRAFDSKTRQWLSWWLDGRNPSTINPPLRGSFSNGVGTFEGEETVAGRVVKTRVVWSHITSRSARWEQASSMDGMKWETNWTSDFTRVA
jgi:hypothetical protein